MENGVWNLPRLAVVDILHTWTHDRTHGHRPARQAFGPTGGALVVLLCAVVGLVCDGALQGELGWSWPRWVPSPSALLFAGWAAFRLRGALRATSDVRSAMRGALHTALSGAIALAVLHTVGTELSAGWRPQVATLNALIIDEAVRTVLGDEAAASFAAWWSDLALPRVVDLAATAGMQLAWTVVLLVAWLSSSRWLLALVEVIVPGILGAMGLEWMLWGGVIGSGIATDIAQRFVGPEWLWAVDAFEIVAELLVVVVQIAWVAAASWLLANDVVPYALERDRWPIVDTIRATWRLLFGTRVSPRTSTQTER